MEDLASDDADRDPGGLLGQWQRVALKKVGAGIDRLLDSVFDEPLDVPDRETAIELLASDPPSIQVLPAALAALGASLTRWLARARAASVASGGPAAWVARAGVFLAGVGAARAQAAVATGMRDLRVLASYLIARARKEQVVVSKQDVRSVTVSIFVNEHQRIERRRTGGRAGLDAAVAMLRQAASPANAIERRSIAVRRVHAIDRIDLRRL